MQDTSRRIFLEQSSRAVLGLCGASLAMGRPASAGASPAKRPNVLFAIADDWSWPHASIYGAPVVETPVFDRIAREGCLFHNTFTAAPQCSPNRAATLTGRNVWQIEEAGTHASIFPKKHAVFTDLLEASGYHIGYTCKGWSPGDWKHGGWDRNPAGPDYSRKKTRDVPAKGIKNLDYPANFDAFLEDRPKDAPFFFWFGASEPHRSYEEGSGARAGKEAEDVAVPPFLPDDPVVRNDLLDYFVEVEWFDAQLGKMLSTLEAMGELDNTIVVVTGDNGMPFPRAKANLHEYGTHVPLAVRWPESVRAGQTTEALVSFIDFGPTFLEAAGVQAPESMTGRSVLPLLTKAPDAEARDFVLTGRERHTHARYDNLGYPARAIRTADYLYIRNFRADRWPAGAPEGYHDIDGSPTKSFMMEHREEHAALFALAYEKRPEDELYDIKKDPGCLENLANSGDHKNTCRALRERLMQLLAEQQDPRALGTGDIFESYPRVSHMRPQLGGFAERGKYNPKYQIK